MTDLIDHPKDGRLELLIEGQVVFASYRRQSKRLLIDHVEAPLTLRGTGAAGQFMAALAAKARMDGDQIVPLCSYAAAWFQRRPEHRDLVA
jgi:predicted GNAT family acetyltransferase